MTETLAGREAKCFPWTGRPFDYQREAAEVLAERIPQHLPWSYVVPTCDTKHCLQEEHLKWFSARRIAYPDGVCIYCGMPANTVDHLLPITVTGEAQRKFVAVVPACKECNSMISDKVGHRVTERREFAHDRLRIKNGRLLKSKTWTKKELTQFGPKLRTNIRKAMADREILNERLAWPWEPDFDRRAFELSGFDASVTSELL